MEVLRDGSFMETIVAESLARGLRPSAKVARNKEYLVECVGAVGLDNVLQVLDDLQLNRIDTTATITDGFPYPQLFVFTNLILLCGETDIYELVAGVLTHRLGPVTAGGIWSAMESYDFIYMSNGMVAVLRDAQSKQFALTVVQPKASAICNFNGQVFIGGPGENWI